MNTMNIKTLTLSIILTLSSLPTSATTQEDNLNNLGFSNYTITDIDSNDVYLMTDNNEERPPLLINKDGTGLFFGGEYYQTVAGQFYNVLGRYTYKEMLKAPGFISFKSPNEKYVVNVLTDPNCGYCRQMHSDISSYIENGITINYFSSPGDSRPSSPSRVNFNKAACSSQPAESLTILKEGGTLDTPTPSYCADTTQIHNKFVKLLNAQGTPTNVLPNGAIIRGFMAAEEMLKELKKIPLELL